MNDEQPNNPGPATIDHVVGQTRAVQQLRTALSAHFNDRASVDGGEIALPHILMVGPPGVGKSTLAQIVAQELGCTLHEELAQNLLSPGQVHGLMMMVEPGGVVFLDEIHELLPPCQTVLYRCLEERRLFLGGNRKSITLPAFTFIGATTDEWALSKPLRDRCKVLIRLTHYSENEIAEIVAKRSKRLGWIIEDSAITGIAKRSRGTPRIAVRLLEASHRQSRSEAADRITSQHFNQMCLVEGVDSIGLDCTERRYLSLLKDAQGPVRLNLLATQLALPRRTIESVIESELIRLGLVTKTETGRSLTAAGVEHLNETEKSS